MIVGIGVQLDPAALRAVVVERAGEQLKLVAAHEAACDTGNVQALTRALIDLRARLKISKPIVLGVPSASAILTTVHPLVVAPRRSILAVQFELQQQLPFDLADAMWHHHWLTNGADRRKPKPPAVAKPGAPPAATQRPPSAIPPRDRGVKSVVVAAMRRSLLDERLMCCRGAGLSVQAVVANPVAMVNVCAVARRRSATGSRTAAPTFTLLTLVDGQTAEWIISSANRFQVIPVTSATPETLWQAVAASWDALRAEGGDLPEPISLIGPVSALPNAQAAVAGAPLAGFELPVALEAGLDKPEHPGSVAAMGLAVQGVGMAGVPINLLAGDQHQDRVRIVRRVSMAIGGVAVAIGIVLGINGMLEVRRRSTDRLQTLEQRELLYQSLRPEARSTLKAQHQIERRGQQLEHLVQDAPTLTQMLALITDAMPDDVWLTSLESSKSGMVNGLAEGRAKSFQDVTKFMDQLKRKAGMTTVKPLSTEVISDETLGKELITFSVQFQRPVRSESVDGEGS